MGKETEIPKMQDIKGTITTVPFFKNNKFDYSNIIGFLGTMQKNTVG